jgi:hypothetical protein
MLYHHHSRLEGGPNSMNSFELTHIEFDRHLRHAFLMSDGLDAALRCGAGAAPVDD